jgi:hypothetical protein
VDSYKVTNGKWKSDYDDELRRTLMEAAVACFEALHFAGMVKIFIPITGMEWTI